MTENALGKLLEYDQQKFITCSLDKLTILGDDTGNFETMINNNPFGFIVRQGMAKHPYKRWFPCVDGSNIQWTDLKNFKAIRYEFNPNSVRDNSKEREHRRAVTDVIKAMKNPKVSRFDVAFDFYGHNFNDYKIQDKTSRKKNYWLDNSDNLETLYIGSQGASFRFRIYDKAREQKIESGLNWWRLELQYRDEHCETIFDSKPYIMNPFNTLRVYQPSYKQIENVQERAMVKLLLEEPETIKELNKNTRAKYKKILSTLPSEKEIDLENLFASHHDQILKTILNYVKIAERNNTLSKSKKADRRTQEELDEPIFHYDDYYTEQESEFLLQTAKIHLLYNNHEE
jgi:hypothetical protein